MSKLPIRFEGYFSKSVSFHKGDVIVDIGAHIGSFCIPVFQAHRDVSVFAFEPDPYNYSCLRANVEINDIYRSLFKTKPFAVYNKPGQLLFSSGGNSTIGSISDVDFFLKYEKVKQVSVEATTL